MNGQQRNKTVFYYYDKPQHTHYYISKYYEKKTAPFNPNAGCHYHYIYGDNGAVALYSKDDDLPRGSNGNMYYIHTDHLGSYVALTNADKQVVQCSRFDIWGNLVEPYDNSYTGDTLILYTDVITLPSLNFTLTNRGFTGHEHYPQFKIINMNGRLYDPVIGRFFSPDNFVQMPECTQSFNRYSYALNNPLKYVDPTGELLTEYRNRKGELLYETDDGLTDVIIVKDAQIPKLKEALQEAKNNGTINNPEINREKMHTLGQTLIQYSEEPLKGMTDNWKIGYRTTYKEAYIKEKSQFSFGQWVSSFVAAISQDHGDRGGQDLHSGRSQGIADGNNDREKGYINRLAPWESSKKNPPLLRLY
jgi:RHS repeat-associated protein